MTNLIGTWKIKAITKFNPEKLALEWKPVEEILADPDADPSEVKTLQIKMKFEENGLLRMIVPVPEEVTQAEIDAAVAAGETEVMEDGMIVVEQFPWKTENGKNIYNSGAKGEVLGEKISPWVEIKDTEDGIEIMGYQLIREE